MELRIFTEPQQGASYADLLAVARTTEESGFDAFFRSDHFMAIGGGDGLPGPTDAWLTLAGLARETQRIRLGTLVSPATFRLPGPLAIEVAQVDAMSGGRVELGIGAGWFEGEHRAYGIPFPPPAERFARLDEQLQILTGLWTTPTGTPFSFKGRFYEIDASPGLPKPVQQPRPPLIIGGGGARRTPELTARFADEFNVAFQSVETSTERFNRVREACRAVGRDPSSMVYSNALTVACSDDPATLRRRAQAIGRNPDELRTTGLYGSTSEVLARLEEYAAIGSQRAYLQVLDLHDLDHIRELGTGVLARLPGRPSDAVRGTATSR
ncbi:MAG: LLM class F420-dependent oxidoreductase [Chloroflexi bacterium]|nr:LLM class F420-dependent oxidoreductase [Chloroflexota bacterium]